MTRDTNKITSKDYLKGKKKDKLGSLVKYSHGTNTSTVAPPGTNLRKYYSLIAIDGIYPFSVTTK